MFCMCIHIVLSPLFRSFIPPHPFHVTTRSSSEFLLTRLLLCALTFYSFLKEKEKQEKEKASTGKQWSSALSTSHTHATHRFIGIGHPSIASPFLREQNNSLF
uniref:Uncharacterized protein n=1 Tax=Caenorhabditis japonica TaxID=281687 RepID=A0A8R1ESW2_CAEJA